MSNIKSRAVYAGTFDPVTYGHLDLIDRALRIFDEVIVAVAPSPEKRPLFSVEERMALLGQALAGKRGILLDSFDGLLVDYARRRKARVIIRGLRALSDFDYEFQMALSNRKLCPAIETIFLMPHESYSYLSSKLIKEIASLGGNIKAFVPAAVARAVEEKLK